MREAAALHARVGRALPKPLFGVVVNAGTALPERNGVARAWPWRDRLGTVPRVWWLLALLLAALWPHGLWLTRRLTDGSDEPWGWLAIVTVFVLLVRARGELTLPSRAALVASGLLALLAALMSLWLPPIFAAAVALLALAVFITQALAHRAAAPLAALLLLALPIIASLQFYLGYPLRLATAHFAAPLLGLAGLDVTASGAALLWNGQIILVDPPCAGIGMLWVGSYSAALLSYLKDASPRRTILNGLFAAGVVFVANVLRNALLFFPEAGFLPSLNWLHATIGLAAFAAAVLPIVVFTHRAPLALRAERAGGRNERS